jgi:predicted metal-dependent TIM-barrel fold hydrolase
MNNLEEMNLKKCNMIAELKQKKELDKLYKQNTIELNDYFAYSGKQEVKKKFVDFVNEYKFKKRIIINNDMSKYVLNDNKKS